ncbi:hypothetical protein P4S64_06155 [Vibrio sp. M60_M31a]
MSSRKAIQDSLPVLHRYGLISDKTAAAFYDAIDSIPSIECDRLQLITPSNPNRDIKASDTTIQRAN